jgi:hypothetical protein
MTKEQVIEAIQRCAKKLKRTPNLRELRLMGGTTKQAVYRRFGCRSTRAGRSQSAITVQPSEFGDQFSLPGSDELGPSGAISLRSLPGS